MSEEILINGKKITELSDMFFEYCKLKKKKDEYYLINLDYETKISYLIQALEEIREIAKEGSKSVFADEDCDKIIDKIDEVLNDN